MRALRYLWAFPAYDARRLAHEAANCANLRALGYDVRAFALPCPGGWWSFPRLDAAWRAGERELLTMYSALADALRDCHVLIAAGGAMLHPEFLATTDVCKAFLCADDPESSPILSQPVAPHFDFCFPFNAAVLDDYRSWGCRHVTWLSHWIRPEWQTPTLTETDILEGARDVDAAVFCERVYGLSDRPQRVERLRAALPQMVVRGRGWPQGPASDAEMRNTYRRLRVGFNLHLSRGPCNTRAIELPTHGALQICDNRTHLARVFELDKEAVGFDTIAEAIDQARHYLAHERERREIAAAGFRRVHRDYTLEKQWQRLIDTIAPHCVARYGRRTLAGRCRP